MATINALDNQSAAFTITNGDLTISSGNANLPSTSSSVGQIVQNGVVWLHSYGTDNLFIGTNIGKAGNFTLTGSDSIGIGANCLAAFTSGNSNFALGTNTLNAVTSGSNHVGLGIACLQGITIGNQCIAIGSNAVRYTTGSDNIGIGYQAYQGTVGTTTGTSNICIGTQSGSAYTGAETNNIVIGSALSGTLGESNVTRIGNGQTVAYIAGTVTGSTGLTATTGAITATAGNVVITAGNLTLPTTSSTVGQIVQNGTPVLHTYGSGNTFFGPGVANFSLTGGNNTALGYQAMAGLSSGGSNTCVGFQAMAGGTITGTANCAFGLQSLVSITSGSDNTAYGYFSLPSITSGSRNTIIGRNAAQSLTTNDSDNITIGYAVAGTAGDNNTLRIGSGTGTGAGQINKSFISGIRGITTVNADAIAVLIDSAGQLGTVSSSIRYKKDIRDIQGTDAIYKLRPVQFKYKQDDREAWGLIAEEVEQIIPALVVRNAEGEIESVKYHDLPLLLLAEIQKLRQEIEALKKCSCL